ncbi:unnamed protein product, partial [Phaeothamnion confervicola]
DEKAEEEFSGVDEQLRPLLQPGDSIQFKYNCELVTGMDGRSGILLFCRHNFYMVDNYRQSAEDADWDGAAVGEQSPGSGAGGAGAEAGADAAATDAPIPHACLRWPYEEVAAVHKRRFLLRHVALEVFMVDGQNYLLTLADLSTMGDVYGKLMARDGGMGGDGGIGGGVGVGGSGGGMGIGAVAASLAVAVAGKFRSPTLMTERWVNGQVTNFEYLMHLNTLAGRSYNDLTQYPVFPWVLCDYRSPRLDLSDPAVFRDLSRPMGALNPRREAEFRERFEVLQSMQGEDTHAPPPFHYGTHYSSAAIVTYYLIRLQPFAVKSVRMQGGRFDHPNRLFHSVGAAYHAASGGGAVSGGGAQDSTQDVRELTPEFFYLPEFLENANGYRFGTADAAAGGGGGRTVDTVALPPWAKGSAREFVRLHRCALESDHVSARLHRWIDLIFGALQQGAAAADACNVFYHLTYEGAVDVDAIDDPLKREALVQQIHEFGQTPAQLFKQPHPQRIVAAATAVPAKAAAVMAAAFAGTTGAAAVAGGAAAASGNDSGGVGAEGAAVSGGETLAAADGEAGDAPASTTADATAAGMTKVLANDDGASAENLSAGGAVRDSIKSSPSRIAAAGNATAAAVAAASRLAAGEEEDIVYATTARISAAIAAAAVAAGAAAAKARGGNNSSASPDGGIESVALAMKVASFKDYPRRFVYECPQLLSVASQGAVCSTLATLLRPSALGLRAQPQLGSLLGCLQPLRRPNGGTPRPEDVVGHIFSPLDGPRERLGGGGGAGGGGGTGGGNGIGSNAGSGGGSGGILDGNTGRYLAVNAGCLLLPPRCTEFVSWGFADCSLRLCAVGAA